MPSSFPTSYDTLTNPTPGSALTDSTVPHAGQHTNVNDIIEAMQAKLGIGPSNQAPAANRILRGTGPGTSEFGQLVNADVAAAAAIVYAKLNLINSILDGDISPTAAIALSKLAHVGAGNVLRSNGSTNVAGKIQSGDIAGGAINSSHIQDGSISGTDLFNDTITAAQMAPNSVGSSELADGAINRTAQIANGTILSQHLGAAQIGAREIADRSIGVSEIALGAVSYQEIALGSVGNGYLATITPGSAYSGASQTDIPGSYVPLNIVSNNSGVILIGALMVTLNPGNQYCWIGLKYNGNSPWIEYPVGQIAYPGQIVVPVVYWHANVAAGNPYYTMSYRTSGGATATVGPGNFIGVELRR